MKLPMIFSDHMVLQRGKPIAIRGEAEAGTTVSVRLSDAQGVIAAAEAHADDAGAWQATLPALEVARGLTLELSAGDERVRMDDVSVGEVWIAGGQSNMEYWLHFDAENEMALNRPENPDIRFFDYPEVSFEGELEQHDFSDFGFWRRCNSEELPWFSAVGYYFAERLQAALGVPVGIVGCNWGGTNAACWMDESDLRGSAGEVWLTEHEKRLEEMDQDDYIQWFLSEPSNIQNHPIPGDCPEVLFPGLSREEQRRLMEGPKSRYDGVIGPLHPCRPCGLYHLMLEKVAPYAARGVIWYQGESDRPHADIYDGVLENMIRAWRRLWNDELPFLMVQLAPFGEWFGESGEAYPTLRACQQRVAERVPQVWLCSSGDAGMRWDIHPKHKRPIGERLALLARGHVYGESILCDAPALKAVRREGSRAILDFEHGDGLYIRGDALNALRVNGQVCPAKVEGECLVIDLPMAEHWKIEFAWQGYYEVNLYNAAGIPALPFRILLD
ncbi:MAG: sialate O-acetylesterase [Clostridia bacterium]|nr:sialate O-acetylesterase [Clostridia bacterium]